jgi:aspartate aminotransferase
MSLTLSKRCLAISPSVTLAIDTKAKALKAQGADVIGFGAGEPDFDTPEYIRNAAKYALDNGMTRYTPVAGTMDLRSEIAKKLLRDNNLTYTTDEILVTNGAKHALFNAFSAILNPGDEVLIPAPCWVSYPEIVKMTGGTPVLVTGDEKDGFLVDAAMLEKAVTPKTKAIILNSPNNPNGCVWTKEMLQGIADLALAKELWIVSDEIYEKLIYDGLKHVSVAGRRREKPDHRDQRPFEILRHDRMARGIRGGTPRGHQGDDVHAEPFHQQRQFHRAIRRGRRAHERRGMHGGNGERI